MGARSGGGRENSSRQALVVKREGVERGGEIQGVKRRLRLRAGVEGGGSWQFQARDKQECWMSIYRAETKKEKKQS